MRQRQGRRSATFRVMILTLLAVLLAACATAPGGGDAAGNRPAGTGGARDIPHIHGIGFSADGRALWVAAHDGFRVYSDGRWTAPAGPAHDYMGYSPVDFGFYSSGHPAPGSNLKNPLGLVKSSDGGQTLQTLAFAGQSDFHLMAAGYRSHAIYAINPAAVPGLAAGPHRTLDEGKTWQPRPFTGVTGPLLQLAVHPDEADVVAAAGEQGLFVSTDGGANFARVGDGSPVAAVAFDPAGDRLWAGFRTLASAEPVAGAVKPLAAVTIPAMGEGDAIAFVAANPKEAAELAYATFQRHIYRSGDGGGTWQQIARLGQVTAP